MNRNGRVDPLPIADTKSPANTTHAWRGRAGSRPARPVSLQRPFTRAIVLRAMRSSILTARASSGAVQPRAVDACFAEGAGHARRVSAQLATGQSVADYHICAPFAGDEISAHDIAASGNR